MLQKKTHSLNKGPENRRPKTETRNPKPETRNPTTEHRKPHTERQNPNGTRNPKPETRNLTTEIDMDKDAFAVATFVRERFTPLKAILPFEAGGSTVLISKARVLRGQQIPSPRPWEMIR